MMIKTCAQLLIVFGLFGGCAVGADDVSERDQINNIEVTSSRSVEDGRLLDVVDLRKACPGYLLPTDLDQPVLIEFRPDMDIISGKEINRSYNIDCIVILCVNEYGCVVNAVVHEGESSIFADNIVDLLMKWKFRPCTKHNEKVGFIYAARMIIKIN